MKLLAAILGLMLVTGPVMADVYSIAKQQARNAANGQTGAQPAPPPPQNNPPPDPALQATFQNIADLQFDFERLNSNPTNTQPLIKHLTAAAQGTKPSAAAVAEVARSLATALNSNKKIAVQEHRLAQNIHAIFNSSHLAPAQQTMIYDSVQKILEDSGVSSDDTSKVIASLKAIATETR